MNKLAWFKSTYSSHNGACVECARTPDGSMAVRDSKHLATSPLAFRREAWREFLAAVRRA
jgi:hypothetical protein